MFQILVVEDDKNTRGFICEALRTNGYLPFIAENGEEALEVLYEQHIDLIVADIMMPKMDGFELTRQLREENATLPILMVSAKQLPEDKRQGFIAGTDDYMTKPFDVGELLLRVKALLRRAQIINSHKLVIGKVTLDYDSLTVKRGENTLTLPPKEFYLLYKLLSYPGRIFTRIQLMDEIWGMDTDSNDHTVNVHINRLRSRFESFPEFSIITIRGLGYKAVKNID